MLTGAQLDAIIIGAGTINLGDGHDTIYLTSTSADLNALGEQEFVGPNSIANERIQGVEEILAPRDGRREDNPERPARSLRDHRQPV